MRRNLRPRCLARRAINCVMFLRIRKNCCSSFWRQKAIAEWGAAEGDWDLALGAEVAPVAAAVRPGVVEPAPGEVCGMPVNLAHQELAQVAAVALVAVDPEAVDPEVAAPALVAVKAGVV